MNFCPNCGNTLVNGNCPACNYQDKNNIGFNILSFFFPLVGLILFIVWKDEHPVKAKGCGKAALISVIVNIVLTIALSLLSQFIMHSTTEMMGEIIENESAVMAAISSLYI